MTDFDTDAIIAKVRKLMALAENNPNENEAASAAEKAMELLAAYNLDMAQVNASNKEQSAPRQRDTKSGGLYAWQRDLWNAVSQLNFCHYSYKQGNKLGQKYEHVIVGSKANVISTQLMAEYLMQTIERLAKTYAKERMMNVFAREAIAYREGMSDRITSRLREMRRKQQAEEQAKAERQRAEEAARAKHPGYTSSGTGLVLADVIQTEQDLNDDFIYGLAPGTTAQRRAESKARQAAAIAAYNKQMAEREAFEEANPDVKAKRLAEEAALNAEWNKRERKRQERASKRGPQYRAESPREKRQNTGSYRAGAQAGDTVSLHRQASDDKRNKLT